MRFAMLALRCAGSAVLLAGCSPDATPTDGPTVFPRPTVTGTSPPSSAVRLANRYHQSGGEAEVYGIQEASGPGHVSLVTVWTRSAKADGDKFDELRKSVIGFLRQQDHSSMKDGYLMEVFGANGVLQHRIDARP